MKIAFIGEAVSGFGGMEQSFVMLLLPSGNNISKVKFLSFVVMTKWIRDGWKVLSTRVHFPIFA